MKLFGLWPRVLTALKGLVIFVAAAFCEIGGCYGYWLSLRLGRSPLFLLLGTGLLIAFAWLLTRSPAAFAGRSFAAYGGVYIAASLAWLRVVEGEALRAMDLAGAGLALLGAAVILAGRP